MLWNMTNDQLVRFSNECRLEFIGLHDTEDLKGRVAGLRDASLKETDAGRAAKIVLGDILDVLWTRIAGPTAYVEFCIDKGLVA